MNDRIISFLVFACALGSGLIAGVFFAFSAFVMSALARLPPPQGIAAMQSINVVVINPLFMGVFLGTALLCAALAVITVMHSSGPRLLIIAGCLLYLVGSLGVTLGANVPLNNALAGVDNLSAEGTALWQTYLSGWTFWNHIRGVAALAACAVFIAAYSVGS